jgi:hypothetical protein
MIYFDITFINNYLVEHHNHHHRDLHLKDPCIQMYQNEHDNRYLMMMMSNNLSIGKLFFSNFLFSVNQFKLNPVLISHHHKDLKGIID